MSLRLCRLALLGLLALMSSAAPLRAADDALGKPAKLDFAHEIAPIFREHCVKCHTGDKKQGGFSLNSRAELLAGGENGPVVALDKNGGGKSNASELIRRLTTDDADRHMPPAPEKPVPAAKIALLKTWIDQGLVWDEDFVFVRPAYEPPLRPRKVALPPAMAGRTNPIDRLLDDYLARRKLPRPAPIDDATFARRASLDLVGLLPTTKQLDAFLADTSPDKRTKFIRALLADDVAYAEHWLTFWNDLLRNDYTGTGFITGGRKQISRWLYDALAMNIPYDRLARELVDPPTPDSAGFADGIRWRGDVSAGQTVEIQFAQSVGQTFLGINLKCASCHDSFIDRWKLDEAYGLAAVYASTPLEIHRCDKPIGKQAKAAWLFPELGQIDAGAPRPERIKQLAALLTHPENGRFTRTLVNRFWHRLMGRGIVHPVDAMQTEPWNSDLLDFLAAHLAAERYDLKQTLLLIATSEAYQSRVEIIGDDADERSYVYAGPRAKRMTAEQFVDGVWQLTAGAPTKFDAPLLRGKAEPSAVAAEILSGKWIAPHASADKQSADHTFRGTLTLPKAPLQGTVVIVAADGYSLLVNRKQAAVGTARSVSQPTTITPQLRAGANEFLLTISPGRQASNGSSAFLEARIMLADGSLMRFATDDLWQSTPYKPDRNGQVVVETASAKPGEPAKSTEPRWQPVAHPPAPEWALALQEALRSGLVRGSLKVEQPVRASLVKSDFLMRSLGRPNRDQIVSVRPAELTTLEAIDLSNGETLAKALTVGAPKILAAHPGKPADLVVAIFRAALARTPSTDELAVARDILGSEPTARNVEDLLWAVLMLPEFQLVR
ncbi:MAG: PSD1 and planctomycete cytochrome C domain-containing protein [Planctomycetia bacterium]|nr:PSD1 and planctomycete cytochrome C domain-containing protein [Planctomycetia bacterium]